MLLLYHYDEEDILLVITPHRYAVLSSISYYPGNELVGLLLSGFRAALITISDMAPTTQHPDGWLVILLGYCWNPCKPWHLSFTLTLRVGGNCPDDSVDVNSSILYHWTGTLIRHICLAQKRHLLKIFTLAVCTLQHTCLQVNGWTTNSVISKTVYISFISLLHYYNHVISTSASRCIDPIYW